MKRKAKFVSLNDLSDNFLGGLRNVILSASETKGDVYLVKGKMPKGSEVPLHVHELEDEIFHVLKGTVELTLGDKKLVGKKGDIFYLPREINHAIKTIGNDTAEVLNYVIPGKNFELFFNKMNAIGLDATLDEKSKIANEHKIKFL